MADSSGCLAFLLRLFTPSRSKPETSVSKSSSIQSASPLSDLNAASLEFEVIRQQAKEVASSLSDLNAVSLEFEEMGKEMISYQLSDRFLSPAEQVFYQTLRSVTQDRLSINSKVRLGDLFSTPDKNAYIRISYKHVDFLLCEPSTMRPIVAIELDDSSHSRSDRQERDDFVDSVFESAQLPLLHVRAQRTYSMKS